MAGRKPIPTQIKKMQGTLEKSRLNKNEPELPVSIPKIPNYFDKYAVEAFEFLGVKTYEMRIVTEADKIKPRPENLIKDKAMNRMRALLTEFGLTPSSRARVNSQEKIEINDIENLID